MFLCQSSKSSGCFGSEEASKKLRRHIGLGLFVRLSVHLSDMLVHGEEPLEIGY